MSDKRRKIWRLKDHIRTPIDVANYLEASLQEQDYEFLKIAVKDAISLLHSIERSRNLVKAVEKLKTEE